MADKSKDNSLMSAKLAVGMTTGWVLLMAACGFLGATFMGA